MSLRIRHKSFADSSVTKRLLMARVMRGSGCGKEWEYRRRTRGLRQPRGVMQEDTSHGGSVCVVRRVYWLQSGNP